MKVFTIIKTSLLVAVLSTGSYACNASLLGKKPSAKKYSTREASAKAQKKYTEVWDFKDGLAAVSQDTRWGFIDKTTELAIPMIYDEVTTFSEDLACVRKGRRWGVVNTEGKQIVLYIYDKIFPFDQGLAIVVRNGKWGMINKKGIALHNTFSFYRFFNRY